MRDGETASFKGSGWDFPSSSSSSVREECVGYDSRVVNGVVWVGSDRESRWDRMREVVAGAR